MIWVTSPLFSVPTENGEDLKMRSIHLENNFELFHMQTVYISSTKLQILFCYYLSLFVKLFRFRIFKRRIGSINRIVVAFIPWVSALKLKILKYMRHQTNLLKTDWDKGYCEVFSFKCGSNRIRLLKHSQVIHVAFT